VKVRLVGQFRHSHELIRLEDGVNKVNWTLSEGFAELFVIVERASPDSVLNGLVNIIAVLASDNEELAILEVRGLNLLVDDFE